MADDKDPKAGAAGADTAAPAAAPGKKLPKVGTRDWILNTGAYPMTAHHKDPKQVVVYEPGVPKKVDITDWVVTQCGESGSLQVTTDPN